MTDEMPNEKNFSLGLWHKSSKTKERKRDIETKKGRDEEIIDMNK